ncbi:MAG: DUF4364 family protein, partial [Candidatus Bathyarchaeota archaeon]
SKGTTKPTQIMYRTNLSWVTLKELFGTLIRGGFITETHEKNAQRYYITEKGKNALVYHLKSLEGLIEVNTFSRIISR